MLEKIISKFSLQTMRIDFQVIACLVILWLLITGCTVSSILSKPFSQKQRNFWLVIVMAFPLLGILAYLPFSINKEDVPDIFLMKQQKKGKRRSEGQQSGRPH
jgi:hypothetical protein